MKWFCLGTLIIAQLSYWAFLFWDLHRTPSSPVVKYTQLVDLGEREPGEEVQGEVVIKNVGGKELQATEVATSCSCGGLFLGDKRVTEFSVPPGKKITLTFTLVVKGLRPGIYAQRFNFKTNDPNHPDGQVDVYYKVNSGGISFMPPLVSFGKLRIGQSARQVVEIWDEVSPPRKIYAVTSLSPLKVNFLESGEVCEGRTLLERLEIVPDTSSIAILDGVITVSFTDPKIAPLRLTVMGRVGGDDEG